MVVILVVLIALLLLEGWVIFVLTRRLLQFDELFQETAGVLSGYSDDLERMSSADLDGVLVDHPEVLAFHRRNLRARQEIQSILESITVVSPRQRAVEERLPPPDME